MRGIWVHSATNTTQAAARAIYGDAGGCIEPVAALAALAEQIPPPAGPAEILFVRHLLQRFAWEALLWHASRRRLSPADVTTQYDRILRVMESTPWPCLGAQLRGLDHPQDLAARTRAYIARHAAEDMSLRTIAADVGASVRYITGAFAGRYGITIHHYIIQQRLERAIHLVCETDWKFHRIAMEVGWRSRATLHRQCHRILRTTPERLRRDRLAAVEALRTLRDNSPLTPD